jgi:hypothetical protein
MRAIGTKDSLAALLIAGQSQSTSGRKSSEPSFESFCCPSLNFFQAATNAMRTFTVASKASRQTCAAIELLSAPHRRSVMPLRANFLFEEAIAVRTADPALPADSAVG